MVHVYYMYLGTYNVCYGYLWLGILCTQVKSSIQDIVDEVAPIQKAPLWG